MRGLAPASLLMLAGAGPVDPRASSVAALIPDRVPDRQKGWVSALTGLGLASAHGWPVIAASYAILGCGEGCYFAADLALVAQAPPSLKTAGRDLGVVNLSSTLPQVAGPALASLLLSLAGPDLRWVYSAAALLAVLGAALAAPIRHVR